MATYQKFNSFVEAVAEKKHNLGSDTLKVALTSVAPDASFTVLADLTEINYANLSARTLTASGSAQVGGTYKLTIDDLMLTASGGAVEAFRYIVVYNDTAANKELIAFFDYGSSVVLLDTNQLNLDFDGTNGLLQLA